MTEKILIIEDNAELAGLLEMHLQETGYDADLAADGPSGLEKALSGKYGLVILDLMLPGLNGLELCKKLRTAPSYIPILMLTAKSSELDRILGLELGADDYVTKPFSIMELMARVKAILRRVEKIQEPGPAGPGPLVHSNGLSIDARKRKVTFNGREITLTAVEFDLLHHFASHPGQVFSRRQLLENVWGYGNDGYEHTVNSHITRLRTKLEADPARPQYILTVWGVGYKFTDL